MSAKIKWRKSKRLCKNAKPAKTKFKLRLRLNEAKRRRKLKSKETSKLQKLLSNVLNVTKFSRKSSSRKAFFSKNVILNQSTISTESFMRTKSKQKILNGLMRQRILKFNAATWKNFFKRLRNLDRLLTTT